MTVDPAKAAGHFEHDGTTYYFCSKGCLAKFAADPQKYLSGTPEPMKAHGVTPAVISIGSLKKPTAPGTGHPAPAAKPVQYTCPMHPEIVQDGPGSCPICGMALEPRVPTLSDAPNPELVDMTRRFWI